MELIPPFSYGFGIEDLDTDLSELDNIDSWTQGSTAGEFKQNRNSRLLEQYPKVRDKLLERFLDFNQNYLHINSDFRISTSWSIKLKTGDAIHFHRHRNSFYSGVLYYGTYNEEDIASLCFVNPIGAQLDFYLNDGGDTSPLLDNFSVPPAHNRLVLFPSCIEHWMPAYQGKEDRVSLSFNIVPIGEYGNGDSKINTEWLI